MTAEEAPGSPEYDGTVIESMPNEMYRIELKSGEKVIAHVASEMRMRFTRIVPGDAVRVALSEFDHGRGRVTHRY